MSEIERYTALNSRSYGRVCPEPKRSVPAPGEVGADRRANCPLCGLRVAVTVRGLYWRHLRRAVRALEGK